MKGLVPPTTAAPMMYAYYQQMAWWESDGAWCREVMKVRGAATSGTAGSDGRWSQEQIATINALTRQTKGWSCTRNHVPNTESSATEDAGDHSNLRRRLDPGNRLEQHSKTANSDTVPIIH